MTIMGTRYCTGCGSDLADSEQFCTICGLPRTATGAHDSTVLRGPQPVSGAPRQGSRNWLAISAAIAVPMLLAATIFGVLLVQKSQQETATQLAALQAQALQSQADAPAPTPTKDSYSTKTAPAAPVPAPAAEPDAVDAGTSVDGLWSGSWPADNGSKYTVDLNLTEDSEGRISGTVEATSAATGNWGKYNVVGHRNGDNVILDGVSWVSKPNSKWFMDHFDMTVGGIEMSGRTSPVDDPNNYQSTINVNRGE